MTSEQPQRINILLTHLHMDHLEGLGFFAPLWNPEVDLHIWGPPSPTHSLAERIERYFSPPLFPVQLGDVPSRPVFHDADEEWEIGGARVSACSISHSGPTVGYRIEENGSALAYMPDHEPMLGKDPHAVDPEWLSGHEIAQGADVLVHDSQYTAEEYEERVGWGHSSFEHVVAFGLVSGVTTLVMFHHDPMHTDDMLDKKLAYARELWGGDGPVNAYEGLEIEL
jgi:ribonuclease BN (tRNA processing enzyme)